MTTITAPDAKRRKARTRVPISLVLVLVLGGMTSIMAVVIGSSFYFAAISSTGQLVDDLGRAALTQLTNGIESELQPAANQSRFLSDLLSRDQIDPNDDQRLQDLLLGSLASVRQLRAVAYVGVNGRMIWAGPNADGRGYSAEVRRLSDSDQVPKIIEEAKKRAAPFWTKPTQFDISDGPLLIAVAPVFQDTEVIGIVGAAISTRTASEALQRLAGESEIVPYVLTRDGRVLLHGSTAAVVPPGRAWKDGAILPTRAEFPDPVLAAMKWPPPGLGDERREEQSGGLHIERVQLADGTHLIVNQRLVGYGAEDWVVGYHLSETRLDVAYGAINKTIWFALIVLAVALVLAFWLGRSIARPMIILSQAGQRLARLDFTPLEIKSSRIHEVERAVEAQRAMRNGLQWLSNYIPRSLTPLLMKSGDELTSREREIVVLFTDIVGFSGTAEGRAAAKVAALLNRHFGLLGTIIEQEGGTIDKYIGDSVMAFWGAPVDQEDSADRAVRAAQRIAQKLHVDNTRRARKGLKPIRIRIGIHKGLALVGNIGAPGRVNYTLVGDTVNVAQRLEQFGREVDDGKADAIIIISEELAKALPIGYALIDRGKQVLHGRSTEMQVYQVPMM